MRIPKETSYYRNSDPTMLVYVNSIYEMSMNTINNRHLIPDRSIPYFCFIELLNRSGEEVPVEVARFQQLQTRTPQKT